MLLRKAGMGRRYVGKLRAELEESAWRYFHAPAERERIRSVLVDLSQTALAFTQITHKALEQLSSGIAPRLRCAPLLKPCQGPCMLFKSERHTIGNLVMCLADACPSLHVWQVTQ